MCGGVEFCSDLFISKSMTLISKSSDFDGSKSGSKSGSELTLMHQSQDIADLSWLWWHQSQDIADLSWLWWHQSQDIADLSWLWCIKVVLVSNFASSKCSRRCLLITIELISTSLKSSNRAHIAWFDSRSVRSAKWFRGEYRAFGDPAWDLTREHHFEDFNTSV